MGMRAFDAPLYGALRGVVDSCCRSRHKVAAIHTVRCLVWRDLGQP